MQHAVVFAVKWLNISAAHLVHKARHPGVVLPQAGGVRGVRGQPLDAVDAHVAHAVHIRSVVRLLLQHAVAVTCRHEEETGLLTFRKKPDLSLHAEHWTLVFRTL